MLLPILDGTLFDKLSVTRSLKVSRDDPFCYSPRRERDRNRDRSPERTRDRDKPRKKDDHGPTFDSAVDSYVNSLKKMSRPRAPVVAGKFTAR